MHHVKYVDGNWHIIDSDERTLFIGNKQQVEDWLDAQEIASKRMSSAPVSNVPQIVRSAEPQTDPCFAPGLQLDSP